MCTLSWTIAAIISCYIVILVFLTKKNHKQQQQHWSGKSLTQRRGRQNCLNAAPKNIIVKMLSCSQGRQNDFYVILWPKLWQSEHSLWLWQHFVVSGSKVASPAFSSEYFVSSCIRESSLDLILNTRLPWVNECNFDSFTFFHYCKSVRQELLNLNFTFNSITY